MDSAPAFWVYILQNPQGTYYVGQTDDLDCRLTNHATYSPQPSEVFLCTCLIVFMVLVDVAIPLPIRQHSCHLSLISLGFGCFYVKNDAMPDKRTRLFSSRRWQRLEAIMTEMNIHILPKVIALFAAGITLGAIRAFADPGDLDPTFGTGGVTHKIYGEHSGGVNGIALQSDGKIVVTGFANLIPSYLFTTVRYHPDGTPDENFGSGGLVLQFIGSANSYGSAVAIQKDGKIVIAGFYDAPEEAGFVVRLQSNGSSDPTFGGGNGERRLFGLAKVSSMALQIDGKILVAGGTGYAFGLCRLNADGSLDGTFGSQGYTAARFGDDFSDGHRSYSEAMMVQSDGRIVLAGWLQVSGQKKFALARFLLDGQLDVTFGAGGLMTVQVGQGDNGANSVVVQGDGKILVGGYADNGNGKDFALVRLLQWGLIDVTFGTNSVVITDFDGYQDGCTSLAVQADGKILAGGYQNSYNSGLARYNSNGSLDPRFGNGGKVKGNAWLAKKASITLQSDGRILLAAGNDFTVARYLATGEPEIAVEQPAGNDLTHGSARVDFANAEVGRTPAIRTFTVRNAGTSSLKGLAITKDGANAGDFTVGPLGATNLFMGSNTTFTVVFSPSELGARTAAIHIASNDPDENPFHIALEGTGVPPLTIVTASPLPPGTVGGAYDVALYASGGTTTYRAWSLIDGSLPPGLSLSGTGLFSGTPTTATNTSFTVRATCGGASSTTKRFDLKILGPSDPGALDPTFGSGGTVATPLIGSDDHVGGLALQGDGKLVVAGSSFNGSNYNFAVVRYNPSGTLDTSFGTGGKVVTPIGPGDARGLSVALQRDGRILLGGYAHTNTTVDFAVVRYHADGALDTTFGSGGKVTTPVSTDSGWGHSVTTQSDGKILVAGYVGNPERFALVRYNSNGSLDTAFGNEGAVTMGISRRNFSQGVVVQEDGKVLLAGFCEHENGSIDFALARFLADGTPDATFGTDGKVATPVGIANDFGWSVAVQGDRKILVAGSADTTGNGHSDFALVRYLPDGNLDASFGSRGKVTTDCASGLSDSGNSLTLQSDGKIVVAGSCDNGENQDFAVARYLADGTLDSSFGNGGKIVTPLGDSNDYGRAIVVQPDGKMVVAGDSYRGTNSHFALVRYSGTTTPEIVVEQPAGNNLTDGSSTVDFGRLALDGGRATCWFRVRNASTATLTGLAVSLDGVNASEFSLGPLEATTLGPGGSTTFTVQCLPTAPGLRMAAIHIASNDADENPFDIALTATGVTAPQITTTSPLPSGMVGLPYDFTLQARGGTTPCTWSLYSALPAGLGFSTNGVLSGVPTTALTTNFNVRVFGSDGLASLKVTFALTILPAFHPGDLDPSFGIGGQVVTPIGNADDFGYSAVLQPDGKILVAGYSVVGKYEDFALVRHLSDGSLDTSFGNGGKVTSGLPLDRDFGRSVALQGDGKILLAGEAWKGGSYKFALERYQPDGTLDSAFGQDGRLTNSIGTGSYCRTVMVQPDGRIVLAGEVNAGGIDFGVVRCLPSGFLDPLFGSGGVMTTDLGCTPNFDYAQGAALQADGKILVTGYVSGTNLSDFGLVRYLGDGILDTSFGNGGIVKTSFGNSQDLARAVVMQTDGKILVTGEVGRDFGLARYLSNGSLDASFGNGGKVITAIDRYEAFPRGMAVQSDGKIVVAGYTSNGKDNDFALARFNPDGTLDVSFSGDGKLMTDIGGGHDRARSVVIQPDGKIVVAGESYNGTNYDFAVVRYLGSLEPEIAVEQPAGTHLTDGGTRVDFGAVALDGRPAGRTFTVRSIGTASLTGLAITKDGVNAGDFAVETLPTTSLAPGGQVSFNVTFTPGAAGARTAAIHLSSNDADESPFDIVFTGTGGSDTPLQAWRRAHFGSPDNGGDGADANDFDRDGYVNLLEYASGGNPKAPDAAALRPTGTFAEGKFIYTFLCDARCTDITYSVQFATMLVTGSWTDIARSVGGLPVSPEIRTPVGPLCEVSDTGIGLRRVALTISPQKLGNTQGFIRVKIHQ
jgi:uncharacterized delta-60 repeat protein